MIFLFTIPTTECRVSFVQGAELGLGVEEAIRGLRLSWIFSNTNKELLISQDLSSRRHLLSGCAQQFQAIQEPKDSDIAGWNCLWLFHPLKPSCFLHSRGISFPTSGWLLGTNAQKQSKGTSRTWLLWRIQHIQAFILGRTRNACNKSQLSCTGLTSS